ncbi:MAG: hypothetical protein LBK82_02290 [Planctomycetaceae bacterium]|nr:hypothetical protein [Planctomycetaceae bacterium]
MGYLSKKFAEGSRRLSHNFAVVNLVHSRLTPTQPFSERLPTYKKVAHLMIAYEILPNSCYAP